MSFLNLRRLLPTRKVWKILTNKLQIKLHNLDRSKAITKPKTQYSYRTRNKLGWPFILIQPKKLKLKRKPHALIHLNRGTPVYIGRLLIDSVSTVKERSQPRAAAIAKEAKNKKPCNSSHLEKRMAIHHKSYQPETRKEGTTATSDSGRSDEADDMWESMVLTSPHKEGINERAEEFIARFRAQIHHQEMLARRP